MTDNNPWADINKIGALDQKLYDQPESKPTTAPSEPLKKQAPKSTKKRAEQRENHEIMKSRNHEITSPTDRQGEKPEKYSTLLKRSLVKKIKGHAIEMEMSDYEVIDHALTEYFEKHQ